VAPGTINNARVYDLENQIPENRAVLSFNWASGGMFGALLRFNYYDSWSTTSGLFDPTPPGGNQVVYDYGSSLLVDAEISMTFNDMFTVTLGGENVFDEYPDDEQDGTLDFLGLNYALTSPYGFNGGFYYLRLGRQFLINLGHGQGGGRRCRPPLHQGGVAMMMFTRPDRHRRPTGGICVRGHGLRQGHA
jgi:iron complex outermembrane receptor protein